jgi:hypothetical protein
MATFELCEEQKLKEEENVQVLNREGIHIRTDLNRGDQFSRKNLQGRIKKITQTGPPKVDVMQKM